MTIAAHPAARNLVIDRLSRLLSLAALALLASVFLAGCGGVEGDEADDFAQDDAEITRLPQSWVKRQSIGNCWIYAMASWTESLTLQFSAAAPLNASESYWTYWHWFEGITADDLENGEIGTGGSWDVAKAIIFRRGVIAEADFIPEEAAAEMSARQKEALTAMNASLKTGALKTPAARRDRALVKAELEKAWRLTDGVKAQLVKLFGADYAKDLTQKSGSRFVVSTAGTSVKRASTIKVKYATAPGKAPVTKTLENALKEWKEVSYWSTSYASGRRAYEQRIQKALHANAPVIMSWFVDFNALDGTGAFRAPPATPGHQGGHMTVLHDYEIENVPGFGTLKAGVDETRKAALDAALDANAKISFFRTKNSWGSARADRAFSQPGYHDLYSAYLFGKVKRCPEDSKTNCVDATPMQDVVLPPGF